MIANNVETASRTVKRQQRYEWELEDTITDSVFAAGSPAELKTLIQVRVFSDPRYDKLPKYRQIACEAYYRGVMAGLARASGMEHAPAISMARMKSAPPPRPKRSTPPPKHPDFVSAPRARTSSIPPWMTNAPASTPPISIFPPGPSVPFMQGAHP